MSTYACRECGATDGFYTIEMSPERYYFEIDATDGEPEATAFVHAGSDDSYDSTIESYNCGACGTEADTLADLVEAIDAASDEEAA